MAKEPDAEREPLKYPQLSIAQFELWIDHPVTKTFLACMDFKRLDARDAAGDGRLVDSSNADLTHANIHSMLGEQAAYTAAQDPLAILAFYEVIEIPEPEKEEDEDE